MKPSAGPAVVLVHGLWMPGFELGLMARTLAGRGYTPVLFRYPSVTRAPSDNAVRLAARVRALAQPTVHFVAHSLGGIVVRLMYAELGAAAPPGRVVTLGTPHVGSRTAHALRARLWGRWALGRSFHGGLSGALPPWPAERELGSIAGTLGLGVGRLLVRFGEANDGVVAVSETRLPGLCDHLCVPTSHSGLLVDPRVLRATAAFLECGSFVAPQSRLGRSGSRC